MLLIEDLKVSTINHLNDPYELLGLQLSDKNYRKIFRQRRAEFANKLGILCFSQSWNNPVLWSHYGDKHAGICLGFDVSDKLLKIVQYFSSLKSIEADLKTQQSNIDAGIFYELLSRKFQDWSYEEEARLLVSLDKCYRDGKLLFYSFSNDLILKEVIIGPRCDKKPHEILNLAKPFLNDVEITKARLAFKSYRVVPNKRYKKVKLWPNNACA